MYKFRHGIVFVNCVYYFVQLVEEDRWYHFDDAHVTPVSEGDIRTAAAYLLFYRRVKTNSMPNGPEGESSNNVHEEF